MPKFWLAKTILEIKALAASARSDYCRIFCIDWLEWVFYHPTYSIASVGATGTRYTDSYNNFMFLPTDGIGAWLRDSDNIQLRCTNREWVYKPPTFRPYKLGQSVTLCLITPTMIPAGNNQQYHSLTNPAFTSWVSTQLPTNDSFITDNIWNLTHATTICSNDNPRVNNMWGAGGVFWYDTNDMKLYINEANPSESETNGVTLWNDITFDSSSRY